ncbi:MAG: VWA domain-containing protein [Planctomycetota bacterium]
MLSFPWWLLLSILALLPWVGPWRGKDRVQNTLRSLMFLALAFALAQPRFRMNDSDVDRVLIVDRSESVTEDSRQQIDELSQSFTDAGRCHLVLIGQSFDSKEDEPSPYKQTEYRQFDSVTVIEDSANQGTSPLSAAISRAASLIPRGSGGSVTIASDALATRVDDDRAVSALRRRDIPIHWVELPTISRPPTAVEVSWAEPLRKGTTSRLNIRVVCDEASAPNDVSLKQGDATLAAVACKNSTDQIVVLEFEPAQAGFFEADILVSGKTGQEVQVTPVVLPIQDSPSLLYLGDRQKSGVEKLAQMIGPSFDVRSVDSMDAKQMTEALGKADLVMLDDIPSERMSRESEQEIVDAVQSSGVGLVMSGGRAAFGAGGWHDRPIESLLPVEFVQKEEKRDPSTSLVVVIDTSGSMSGVRVQLAKEVARLAMRRLLPHDKVGIVEFYGAKRWAAPLQPASNAIELQRALNRMDAGGGTVILPALEEAFYGLQNVDTRYKHVLVLTDGGVEAGDFESLMRRMASEGINVSTVLAGGGYHSEFLVNIANWGKGRFYNVPNRFNLPEILLKQPSTTKLPSYRPGTHLVRARGGSGWWGDVDTSNVPNLDGYVETKPRPGSQVLLETVAEEHPILSTWRYGLGRVTTLMTEPLGDGTQPWQEWPEYSRALARILQRSAADARDPFRYEVEHDGGEVIVHAIRQQSRSESNSRPVAKLLAKTSANDDSIPPPGAMSENEDPMVNFVARSPDRFLARMPAPALGDHLRIETSANTTPSRWQPLVVTSPVVPEDRVDPRSKQTMARLVAVAGGTTFQPNEDWMNASTSDPSGKTLLSMGSWLFGLTLLFFLAELVWRRLPVRSTSGSGIAQATVVLAIAFGIGISGNAHAQTQLDASLEQRANDMLDLWTQNGVNREEVNELYRAAVLADGTIQPLLDWLFERRGELTDKRGQVIIETEVHLTSKRGDLERASRNLSRLLKIKEISESRQDLQLWQAKLFDALGEVDQAKEIYESLLEQELSEVDQQTVRLRLALMGLIADPRNRSGNAPKGNDAKPLIELAKNSPDTAFRNRAAIVLAVQNKFAEAIELFTIEGEGTIRFRNASRVTEWAIRAQNRDRAIETAWDAVNSAEIKRDRNYALALLVESYRLKEEKKGLEKLVEEFKTKNESEESLPPEVRTVWINLLRELGENDEAIELFKSTTGDAKGFTVEMRRELLEMEGEAGYEDRMIESYRQLIQAEPDELTWRSGLTQILLEKGQEEDARALWNDYVQKVESRSVMLASAQTLGEFGLDDLAEQTIERMVALRADHGQALLYWADLQKRRGDTTTAETTLNRIQALDDVGDEVRAELAGAYERLGRQDKAIEVNEAIRAGRKTVAEDLEMRLAWLYSEVGDEEQALDQWLALWRKTTSVPRRRYVEDRLMTVASRLGTLADIAIELEEKLADGTADDREAGLLIRIYSRVNDSVAATEISEEYMSRSGKNQVERLQEQGRIYQICNDYWNYEKVIERLIEVDPEGETEYLRQLALSMLERGKAQEARAVLMSLRDADDGKDSIGGEFEAGVLSLVGLKSEAAKAYRQAIATYPDRIESYLLLANILKELDQTERAVGMFQYLAENADRDDLFTIAIDGLLNMEARGPSLQWARRITLERLAGREDKNYLYQLLSDLSSEVNDKSGQIRAMENSLAVSGTRRLSVLRECMELSSRIRGGVYYSGASRGPSNRGNRPFFAFGRRLIGLGELMPPQVFLDLGQAFLDDGDTPSAERTFGMARNLADPRAYQREVASIFEKAGKVPEALVRYDKLLRTSPSDVALIARVAKLNEQSGNDDVAFRFYQRGIDLLFSQTPLTTGDQSTSSGNTFWAANRDAYDMYSDQLLQGILVTVPEAQIDSFLQEQADLLQQNLQELDDVADSGRTAKSLSDAPRIDKRSTSLRKIYLAFNRIDQLETMDQLLMNRFREDKGMALRFARERITWGRYDSVQRMLASADLKESEQNQLKSLLGEKSDDSPTAKLIPQEMWQQFLPVWMEGDRDAALKVLRRVDQSRGRAPGSRPTYVIVNGMAVIQNAGSASDVAVWMRLAISLGDEGLALQFARSRLASPNPYGASQIKQLFDTYAAILPEESFADLIRYAANLYKDKKERLAEYLWLVSQMPEYLGDEVPKDRELLQKIEDSNLQINYYFPFPLAMEAFPASIRAEAMADTLDRIVPKYRPRELGQMPFRSDVPIDEELEEVLLDSFKSGIDPALQDNYLRYCVYALPRNGTALKCSENADIAIKMMDLLMDDKVRKRESNVSEVAEFIKAVVLHQSGRTDEALEIVLDSYDPKQNPTDAYVRYARDWAYRELIPIATEKFLDRISDGDETNPTVEQTDQRLSIIRQTGNENLLRNEYRDAIINHPDQAKFVSAYERWEQSLKRPFAVIELTEQRLEETAKEKDSESKVAPLKKRLGDLWLSVNHLPKALPLWSLNDDQDIERFEKEKEDFAKAKEEAEKTKPEQPEDEPEAKVAEETKKKKDYAASVVGLKSAIEDEDMDAAQQTLRKIWRSFPPAVASPYGYRMNNKRMNGLTWPVSKPASSKPAAASDANKPKQPTEEEKAEAAKKARERARGGLAVFKPATPTPRPARESAWKVLADKPFAVSEMKRIVRSRQAPPITNVLDVSLGLLQAERNEQGDEAVFARLVEDVHTGNVSDEVLAHLFKMLDEDFNRINEENQSVIDDLLERLDLTNAQRASQLAELCARVGQTERAIALYRHCALLSTTGSVSFPVLVNQSKEVFEDEELMELVESMYLLTSQKNTEAVPLLSLRLELLSPTEAAERSRVLFESEQEGELFGEMRKCVQAVPIFSRANDIDYATKSLLTALKAHGQPRANPNNAYVYYSTTNNRNLLRLTRNDLVVMFPESDEGFVDYDNWLATAAQAVSSNAAELKPEIVAETLLTIAIRQCERDNQTAATETLKWITPEAIAEAKNLELLAIDVARLAGSHDQALELQRKLYQEKRLTHLRFGDLLRDTASVEGTSAASELLEELVNQSMDVDLLAAADEIAGDDESLKKRVGELRANVESAQSDYDARVAAAKERTEMRREWQKQRQKWQKANAQANATETKNVVVPQTIRALPMSRAIRIP